MARQPASIIVGGGIAGLSLAWELLKYGHCVSVVEQNTIGSGASGVASAYLEPRPGSGGLRAIEWASLRSWPGYAREIETIAQTGTDYRTEGLIHIACDATREKLLAEAETRSQNGWAARWLNPDELSGLEPNLSPHLAGGVWLQDVHWLDGRKFCAALAAAIVARGGRVVENSAITKITKSGTEVFAETYGGMLSADTIVFCNGLGRNTVEGVADDVPTCLPVRGVMVSVQTGPDITPVRRVIKHAGGTICPRSDGRLLIGTTHEEGETSVNVRSEIVEKLLADAEAVLPVTKTLRDYEVFSGVRALVGDGLLRLGQSSEMRGLYYSLSHAGAGFLRAPVISREFAAYIAQDDDAHCPLIDRYLKRPAS